MEKYLQDCLDILASMFTQWHGFKNEARDVARGMRAAGFILAVVVIRLLVILLSPVWIPLAGAWVKWGPRG